MGGAVEIAGIDVVHAGIKRLVQNPGQLAEAQKISEIVCLQNFHNIACREGDAFIDELEAWPTYRFSLWRIYFAAIVGAGCVAASLSATPMQVALAWLLPSRAEYPSDPRHIFGQTSSRESQGCGTRTFAGSNREARLDRSRGLT